MENRESEQIINDGGEDFGSLIRASIDIDGWISNEKTQLEGHESAEPTKNQDFNLPMQTDELNIPEETSHAQFEQRNSDSHEQELYELERREVSEYLAPSEFGNYIFNDPDRGLQELQVQGENLADQNFGADEEPNRGEIGNCVTLERTPAQITYEDFINKKKANPETAMENFTETGVAAGNFVDYMSHRERFQIFTSSQDASPKDFDNPYLEDPQRLTFITRKKSQCQVTAVPKIITYCCKCCEAIEPRDWIRLINTATDFTAVYHMNCFYCEYCKGVFCTGQYYTFQHGKLICNFDFQMLTNLRKVKDRNQKRLVVLHSVKKEKKNSVRISLEQKKILQQALKSRDDGQANLTAKKNL